MKAIIRIEASANFLGAWAENLEGVTADGSTMNELKKNILECIDIQKELGNIPNENY